MLSTILQMMPGGMTPAGSYWGSIWLTMILPAVIVGIVIVVIIAFFFRREEKEAGIVSFPSRMPPQPVPAPSDTAET